MQTRLVLLSSAREQPSPTLIIDGTGRIIGRGALAAGAAAIPFKGRTVLIVPGAQVVTRWIELEQGPSTRVAEAAAALLKDQVGAPLETIHLALGEADDGDARAVCVIDRHLLREYLDRAADFGVSPDVAVPDHLMLPAPGDGVLMAKLGELVAVRGDRVAFTAEEELASVLIGERSRMVIEHASQIEQLLAGAVSNIPVNLLQRDFAAGGFSRSLWRRHRRAAALAAIAALSPLVIWGIQIVHSEAAAQALEARAQAGAREIVGDFGRADPIRQLRGRLAELHANDAFLQRTATLFEALSRTQGAELEALSYVQQGVIRARIVHRTTSGVVALREALEERGVALEEDAAEERNGLTVSTITLRSLS